MNDTQKQRDLLDGNTQWFRVFQDMIFNGEAAKMGPHGFTVYCIIKAHASMHNGESFPGVPLIAKEGGMSEAQVKRELVNLEAMGYLSREKQGRANKYQLRERFEIKDDTGNIQALAWMDYIPMTLKAATADLKNVLLTGDLAGAKIITIEHMVVNIQTGPGYQTNFNGSVDIPEGDLGDSLKKLMRNRGLS